MANSKGQLLPRDLTRTYPRIVYGANGKRYLDAIAGCLVRYDEAGTSWR